MENIVKPATAEVKKNKQRKNKNYVKPTVKAVEDKEISVVVDKLPTVVRPIVKVITEEVKRPIEVTVTVTKKLTFLQKIKNWFKRK